MTGLNLKAFERLLPAFTQAYEQSRANAKVERKRAVGGGRKAKLRTSRDKLFYILLQRPKDSERQKENYSGKKKRHTRKQITVSTQKKRILLLTEAKGGRIHDKRQLVQTSLVDCILTEVAIKGDLGFQGLQNEYENVHWPHKKTRRGE